MAEQLRNFLIALGEDPELQERFKQDKHVVMAEHGLSEEDKALLLEGDKEKIQQATGLDDENAKKFIV